MTDGSKPIGVVGSTGFVGSAVVQALRDRGATVVAIDGREPTDAWPEFVKLRSVINCAGVADATSIGTADLEQANVLLPQEIALRADAAGIRFVHVSSAAVQGRIPVLDSSSERRPFSPYSESKARGEEAVLAGTSTAVVYRPPGVHDASRPVTQRLARLAAGRFAIVARGTTTSPQALLPNVADAVAFLATSRETPPPIVHHPAEGVSPATLLGALGGRPPRQLPRALVVATVRSAFLLGDILPGIAGHARRVEVLMLGQGIADSWLTEAGWAPPNAPAHGWPQLGRRLGAAQNLPRGRTRA